MRLKEKYVSPSIEVVEIENEGTVMTGSDQLPGFGSGGTITRTSSSGRSNQPSNASLSELEDLINDILTIEK